MVDLPVEKKSQYLNDGFVVVENLLEQSELENLRTSLFDVSAGIYKTGVSPDWISPSSIESSKKAFQIANTWKSDDRIRALILHSKVARMAAYLSGVHGLKLWMDLLNIKPPYSAYCLYWHQDYFFYQMVKGKTITAWIPLNDITYESGPLVYLVGSHKLGLVEITPKDTKKLVKSDLVVKCEKLKKIVTMRAGSVIFHHPQVIHGSLRNITGNRRYGFSINYMSSLSKFRPYPKRISINETVLNNIGKTLQRNQYFDFPQFPNVSWI